MEIKYGIASYHRPQCKTLQTLLKLGIDKKNIVVSLNDEQDYKEYTEKYKDEGINIIFRKGGNVAFNRNTILDHFNKGDYVMVLDDDITAFKKYEFNEKSGKLVTMNKEELEKELLDCFEKTKNTKGEFFGIYSMTNTLSIKQTLEEQGLYSINKIFQGGASGFIVGHFRYNSDMLLLDDYEIILRAIKTKTPVLRRNDLCVNKPNMGKEKGGYFDIYKQGKQQEWLIKLKKMYPDMFTIKKDYSGIRLKKGI